MTEVSYFWDGTAIGDAALAPYSATLYGQLWHKMFARSQANDGYIEGHLNELALSGVSGGINIASGAALVAGGFYENTDTVFLALPTPSGSDRVDNIVLQRHWGNQETRLKVLTGVEGTGIGITPIQIEGIKWEYLIGHIGIDTNGVLAIGDARTRARTALAGFNAMQHIETVSASAEINFFDIPQTFRHLVLMGTLFGAADATKVILALSLNGNADAIVNRQVLLVDDSSQNDIAFAEINTTDLGLMEGAASATGPFQGVFSMRFPFYTNTNFYKVIQQNDGLIRNNTLNAFALAAETDMWKNTEAINRITIAPTAVPQSLTASQVSLYGLE